MERIYKLVFVAFKNLISILLICSILVGCGNKGKRQEVAQTEVLPVINLSDNVERVESFSLNDAADGVEIVSLETTDQSLIREVDKMEVTANDIWIKSLDSYVYRFDRSGKFLNKIGKKGQGPGEYTGLWSFQIDEPKKEVYCMSPTSGIFVYDYEGNFKRKYDFRMDNVFTANEQNFRCIQGDFFLFQNLPTMPNIRNPKDSLWSAALVDTLFHIRKIFKNPTHTGREDLLAENGALYNGRKNYWFEYPTSVDLYQGELTLKYPDCDTIYCYNKEAEEFLPQYAIHSDEPRGDYATTHGIFKSRAFYNRFALIDYLRTKDFIYLYGYRDEEIRSYAYNKANGTVAVAKQDGKITEWKTPIGTVQYRFKGLDRLHLWNDWCGCDFRVSERSSGKYWVDMFEGGSERTDAVIESLKESTGSEPQRQELLNRLETMVEKEDNPVLVIAILK